MPKIIKSFTIHIQNPETSTKAMDTYLNKTFGPSYTDEKIWYLGRNYNRPHDESHLEITFYSEPNSKHTLMMLQHPYKIINEDSEEWYEVNNSSFDNLFEV